MGVSDMAWYQDHLDAYHSKITLPKTEAVTKAMEQVRILMPAAAELTYAKMYFCCVALLVKIIP